MSKLLFYCLFLILISAFAPTLWLASLLTTQDMNEQLNESRILNLGNEKSAQGRSSLNELLQDSDAVFIVQLMNTKRVDGEIPKELTGYSSAITRCESEFAVIATLKLAATEAKPPVSDPDHRGRIFVQHCYWKDDTFVSNVPMLFGGTLHKVIWEDQVDESTEGVQQLLILFLKKSNAKEDRHYDLVSGHRSPLLAIRRITSYR